MRKVTACFVAACCFSAEAVTLSAPKQTIRPALASPAGLPSAYDAASPKTVDLAGTPYLSAWLEGAGTELLALREAGELELLADICPGPCSSTPTHMTSLNDKLVFSAYSPATGRRLWTSDGTAANTRPVFDVITEDTPMLSSPFPGLYLEHSRRRYLLRNDALYFAGKTSSYGYELWRTDSTAAGTIRLTDLNIGSDSASPQHLTNCGAALCFSATDGDRAKPWLLSSEDQLHALPEPVGTNLIELLGATSTHLFWRARTNAGDHTLVSHDLINGASTLLQDFSDLEPQGSMLKATIAAGKLYFHITEDVGLPPAIWSSDGSPDGTGPLMLALDETAIGSSILASITGQLLLAIEYPSSRELARFDGTSLVVASTFTTGTMLNPVQQLDDTFILGARDPATGQGQFVHISETSVQQKSANSTDINFAEIHFILGGSQKSESYFYYSLPDTTLPGVLKKIDFGATDQSLAPSWQVGPLAERTLQHNGALIYLGTDGKLHRATRKLVSTVDDWLQGNIPSGLTPLTGGGDISLFRADDQIWGLPISSRELIPVYDGTGRTVVPIAEQLFYSLNEETDDSTLFSVAADGDIQPVMNLAAPERFMGFGSTYNANTSAHWLVSIANGSNYRLIAIDRQTLDVTDLNMFASDQHFRVSGGPAGAFTVQTYDEPSDTTSLWLTDDTLTGYEKLADFSGTPLQSAVIIPGENLAVLFVQRSGASRRIMRMTYGGSASPLTDESGAVLNEYSKTAHVEDGVYLITQTTGNNPTLWKVTETGPAIPVLAGVKGTHNGPKLMGPVEGGILFESSNSERRQVYSLSEQPASSSSGSTNVGYLALMSLLLFRLRRKLS